MLSYEILYYAVYRSLHTVLHKVQMYVFKSNVPFIFDYAICRSLRTVLNMVPNRHVEFHMFHHLGLLPVVRLTQQVWQQVISPIVWIEFRRRVTGVTVNTLIDLIYSESIGVTLLGWTGTYLGARVWVCRSRGFNGYA